MGEVHANDIETSGAKPVDSLDGVRLGTNCTDDRSPSVVLGRFELEGTGYSAQPFHQRISNRLRLSQQDERGHVMFESARIRG